MELIFNFLLSPKVLWTLLAIVFGAWLSLSWVLAYHWRTYAHGNRTMRRATITYFSVSTLAFIIIIMLITLL